MTTRDLLRAVGAAAIAEGLAFAIGGRRATRLLTRLTPAWFGPWLRWFEAAPAILSHLYGVAEVGLGLRILALTPPTPRAVEEVSDLALQPLRVLWRWTIARGAEETYGQLLNEFVRPGARVLDLGSGEGDNLARILEEDLALGSYVGLDTSPAVLARARARFAGIPKVDFFVNDLNQDQLLTGEFDVVLSTWALDRIPDPNDLIVRATRQLRHGGHAVLLFASPVADWRRCPAAFLARLIGHRLRPSTLFDGLPAFTARESFAGGLISLVVLEKSEPIGAVSTPPISQAGVA